MGGIMRAANPAVEVKGLIAALCGCYQPHSALARKRSPR
jgi:hypothetical protein